MGNFTLDGIAGTIIYFFFRLLRLPADLLLGIAGWRALEDFYSLAWGSMRYFVGAALYFICVISAVHLYCILAKIFNIRKK